LVIAVVVLAGSALALFDARNDGDNAARRQVLGIATALADSPSTARRSNPEGPPRPCSP
jgi:hypothetical protein